MGFVEELSAWMPQQRWYAGKGHQPRLRILDAQPATGATRYLVMDDAGAAPTLYHVPLALFPPGSAGDPHPQSTVTADAGGSLVDAPRHPEFARGLLAELGIDPSRVTGVRVLTGEQSNTSLVYDEDGEPTIIVKLFRILHHGENPDVTVQRALSEAGSPYVPRFLGSLDGEWPDVGRDPRAARGTLAFAQEFLPGVRDGWSIAVEEAAAGRSFTDAARDLGVAVAGVHEALAAALPSRDGLPADALAAGAVWRRRLALASAEAPGITARRRAIEAVYDAALARPWPRLQRVHGDLHLGQVLAAPDRGWRIVDFEGEPLRPMTERGEPDLPLRDVAGMLRSFDYASAVGAAPEAGVWATDCRRAFLEAYSSAPGAVQFDEHLLRALIVDKAVYETIYEARNRPEWLPIPLAGIDAALG